MSYDDDDDDNAEDQYCTIP